MKDNGKKKHVLLGWDGADWKVINPLLDQGLMPNLQRVINSGTMSSISTLDPMYSPMLWSSIGTGKRPYKHGVLGFIEPTPDKKSVRPVMSVSRKCKAIWNIFTQENLKNHVVGWWPSHPVEKINGVMVSNFYQNHVGDINTPWPMPNGTVHPSKEASYYAQFRVHPQEITANHLVQFIPKLKEIDQKKDQRPFAVAKITGHASSLHAAFTNILRTKEWDFAALYLDAIDHYSHGFMKYHPPRRPHIVHSDYELYKDVVVAGYRFHDMMLGRILDLIDDDTTLMIVSDHGFQPDHLRPDKIPNEPAGPAYEHNPLGVFVAMGPNIKKDHLTFGASILDITPTILHSAGLAIGEDMDGKVLMDIFENISEISTIDSWESRPGFDGRLQESDIAHKEDNGDAALQQLEDLGYIEKQSNNKAKRLKQTIDECQYNLARSYIDGGILDKAIDILEQLHSDNVNIPQYGIRLAGCYQLSGRHDEAEAIILRFKENENFTGSVTNVMLAGIYIAKNMPLKAIKLLNEAKESVDVNLGRVYLQLAIAYSMLKRWDDALEVLDGEIAYNPDNEIAHFHKGKVLLKNSQFQKASEHFLQALKISFNQPRFHLYLGMALYRNGDYEEAIRALENTIKMHPSNNKAKQILIDIYKNHVDNPSKLEEMKSAFDDSMKGTIYVVSGLPRSGTSMMMQMLQKGGLEIFTDDKRVKDDNNPKGYYEHEAIKSLAKNNKWIYSAKGKAMKVIVHLLKHLPSNYHYKVIFMERDLDEIMASQESMLKRLSLQKNLTSNEIDDIRKSYEGTIYKNKKYLALAQNIDVLNMNYNDILNNPFESAINDVIPKK